MNIFSHPLTIRFRNTLREIGILRFIQSSFVYKMTNRGYESKFDQVMKQNILPGDYIFDIGANVGYYTAQFSEWVGTTGKVFAFEPVPESAKKLKNNINVIEMAIGSDKLIAKMALNEDPTSPTNRIVDYIDSQDEMISVEIQSVDNLIQAGYPCPNCMKIDVEGFEYEVFQGLSNTLKKPDLKHIFVEVHFGILAQRGLTDTPSQIDFLLKENGFLIKWVDFSHLHASRDDHEQIQVGI
jgi:FkbM family methyltransferase